MICLHLYTIATTKHTVRLLYEVRLHFSVACVAVVLLAERFAFVYGVSALPEAFWEPPSLSSARDPDCLLSGHPWLSRLLVQSQSSPTSSSRLFVRQQCMLVCGESPQ